MAHNNIVSRDHTNKKLKLQGSGRVKVVMPLPIEESQNTAPTEIDTEIDSSSEVGSAELLGSLPARQQAVPDEPPVFLESPASTVPAQLGEDDGCPAMPEHADGDPWAEPAPVMLPIAPSPADLERRRHPRE